MKYIHKNVLMYKIKRTIKIIPIVQCNVQILRTKYATPLQLFAVYPISYISVFNEYEQCQSEKRREEKSRERESEKRSQLSNSCGIILVSRFTRISLRI